MNIQCLFRTKDRPCLLMRLFCRGILYRPRESVTTSRFYKLIEKCPASDYWQILKTNPSFSINWPGSLLFYFVLQYSYKIMLKNQTKPKGSAQTFWRSCKACIYHEIDKEVYNHQLLSILINFTLEFRYRHRQTRKSLINCTLTKAVVHNFSERKLL